MIISKNDGFFNNDYNNQRDTLINSNTMIYLSREYYKKSELEEIERLKAIS